MKINVDLQLLLYLLGYRSPIIYPLWLMILDKKNEEERTIFIENAIKLYLAEGTSDIDLDLDSLE
ncbi:MAG: hypothetical protein PUJ51_20595 [Clostridiales bacterium]|nr:hypothetical protein [Clostridiales bacterium]